MEANLFQKVVADAALDAGAELRFVRKLTQAEDHPIGAAFSRKVFTSKGWCVKRYKKTPAHAGVFFRLIMQSPPQSH